MQRAVLHAILVSAVLVTAGCDSGWKSTECAALAPASTAPFAPASSVVVQTVSEYGGTPIGDVLVQVDDQPWVATDAQGKAAFAAPGAAFTMRVHQVMISPYSSTHFEDVWVLRGLETNEVVVEVDGSTVPIHRWDVSGIARAHGTGTTVSVWGVAGNVKSNGSYLVSLLSEQGAPHCVTVRALETDGSSPPLHYVGFASTTISVSDASSGNPGYVETGVLVTAPELELQAVGETTGTGVVEVPAGLASLPLRADLSLKFRDPAEYSGPRATASLYLGSITLTAADPSFSYLFPSVPGSTPLVSVGAFESSVAPPLAAGSTAWLVPGAASTTVRLTNPLELLEPSDGATVDLSTVFRSSASAVPGRTYLSGSCEGMDGGIKRSINFRQLDALGTEMGLVTAPGLPLPSGAQCYFAVYFMPSSTDTVTSYSWSRQISVMVP